ncbi:hypothetical protein J5X84_10585 [Streptosporangiaceae bacterium NEAU-GS5]|nr:hypothetical protein [Streptosporangiaceae bacterium NEAU-GS5]
MAKLTRAVRQARKARKRQIAFQLRQAVLTAKSERAERHDGLHKAKRALKPRVRKASWR